MEALTKTQGFFSVDPELLQEVKRWVQQRQEDNGSFVPLAADAKISDKSYPVDTSDTPKFTHFEHSVEMTAETLVLLKEIEVENEVSIK